MIQKKRLTDLLIELIKIDSLSRNELVIANRLQEEMRTLGAEKVWTDDAGEKVGGNVGNVIAHFRGSVPNSTPLLLSAHMDTVMPGEGVVPILEGTILHTDGRTVLGGDDKSGVAIICEVLRVIHEQALPCSDIDVVFTICEELGLLGAKYLDTTGLRARTGLVLDSDSAGYLSTRAPAANRLEFEVEGLAAHAGMCPEKGLSAIEIAARGIAQMRLGRIDDETTANIGIIQGGVAGNIVPASARLRGEARSHNEDKLEGQTRHMIKCLENAASQFTVEVDGKRYAGKITACVERNYDRMAVPEGARIVRLVHAAAGALGLHLENMATGGGCDANVLNKKGLEVANLATGMREIHTVHEWLDLNDLYTSAQLVLETVRLNADNQTQT